MEDILKLIYVYLIEFQSHPPPPTTYQALGFRLSWQYSILLQFYCDVTLWYTWIVHVHIAVYLIPKDQILRVNCCCPVCLQHLKVMRGWIPLENFVMCEALLKLYTWTLCLSSHKGKQISLSPRVRYKRRKIYTSSKLSHWGYEITVFDA